jgi:limonene-1,2-epoxide hydrolase
MRRLPGFLLLMLVFTLSVAACGDTKPAAPADVVASWSQAINAGDDEAAAKLFAPDAVVIQGGQRTQLPGKAEALVFNSSLPCGGKVVKQSVAGNEVTATFTLTRRPDHMCDGTGEPAVTVFTIEDGKITLWHELPQATADAQTA